MLDPRHLLRAKRWAQRPPSERRVKLVFGVIALAALVWGIEWLGFWPDWARADKIPRRF